MERSQGILGVVTEFLNKEAMVGFTVKVTGEQRLEVGERASHVETRQMGVPGRENIQCNEPEVGACLDVQETLSRLCGWLQLNERQRLLMGGLKSILKT